MTASSSAIPGSPASYFSAEILSALSARAGTLRATAYAADASLEDPSAPAALREEADTLLRREGAALLSAVSAALSAGILPDADAGDGETVAEIRAFASAVAEEGVSYLGG
jgi:hypothetical protein